MSEITIERSELPDDYAEMMKTESHHNHVIIKDKNGTLRWKENAFVNELSDKAGLNNLCPLLNELGYGKNSEVYRKLYRDMGYSLSGYWEIFYWEANNEEVDQYKQPAN